MSERVSCRASTPKLPLSLTPLLTITQTVTSDNTVYDLNEFQRLRDQWEPKLEYPLGGDKNSSGSGDGDGEEEAVALGPENKQRGRIGRGALYVGRYTGQLTNFVQVRTVKLQ